MSFSGCTFTNNGGSTGGAIYVGGNTRNTAFSNCKFSSNSATNGGGAIYIASSCYNLTFSGLEISEVSATNAGGAVYIASGCYNICFKGSNFQSSIASGTSRSLLSSATPGIGGAVYIASNANNISFIGTDFISNRANSPGNAAGANGGAMFVADGSTVYIDGSTFRSNTAYSNGGAVALQNSRLNITNSIFISNNATNDFGGAVYFSTTSNYMNVSKSTFTSNSARAGGAMYFAGAVSNQKITESAFNANTARNGDGGAIFYTGNVNTLTIGSNFTANTASGNGPAIAFIGSSNGVVFNNSRVTSHTSSTGAVYFAGTFQTLSIADSTFENNNATSATSSGPFNFASGTTLNVDGSQFTNNRAPNGGALYLPATVSDVNIDKSLFDTNTATGTGASNGGGAVYTNSKLTVTDSDFNKNRARNGGAVYVDGENSEISATFTNNVATVNAGAVYLNKKSTVSKSKFESNNAQNGGAVYLNSAGSTVSANFTSNTANAGGGAIYSANDNTVSASNFTENTAVSNGNAVYAASGSTGIMNSNFNGDNHVYVNGGATASLTKNREINEATDAFSVDNHGNLALSQNEFNTVIINRGVITTPVTVNISGNRTYTFDGFEFPLNASVLDDNNNSIASYALVYTTNHGNLDAPDNVNHNLTLITLFKYYEISATDSGLQNPTVYTAVINVIIRQGSYTWLQDKIDKLEGNVLDLERDVTFDPYYDLSQYNHYVNSGVNFKNGMLYNKTFTLQGNNRTISGFGQARIFDISVSHISITNTNFVNGNSSTTGGALYVSAGVGDVTIGDSAFRNNTAGGEGGAI